MDEKEKGVPQIRVVARDEKEGVAIDVVTDIAGKMSEVEYISEFGMLSASVLTGIFSTAMKKFDEITAQKVIVGIVGQGLRNVENANDGIKKVNIRKFAENLVNIDNEIEQKRLRKRTKRAKIIQKTILISS